MKTKMFLFTILVLCFVASVFATDVSGNVSGTWTVENSPYNVTADIVVPSSQTLTIQPGVEVVFTGDYRLTVQGQLFAVGTESDSISFSGTQTWDTIRLENETQISTFYHCIVTNGSTGINSIGAPMEIHFSRVGNMSDRAISIFGINNPAEIIIKNSKIHDTVKAGISITQNSNVIIEANEITRCGSGPQFFGAIHLQNQSADGECDPLIINNWIHHNFKQGINAWDVTSNSRINPFIINNIIEGNLTGIYLKHASGLIKNNQIINNFITGNVNSGAGIMLEGASCGTIVARNTITGNFTAFYIGVNASPNLGDEYGYPNEGENIIMDNVGPNGVLNSIVLFNTTTDVNAMNNLFHSSDSNEIAASITDSNDNPSLGTVHFEPYLVTGVVRGEIINNNPEFDDRSYIFFLRSIDEDEFGFSKIFFSDQKNFQILVEPGLYFLTVFALDENWIDDRSSNIINRLKNNRIITMIGSYGGFEEPTPLRIQEHIIYDGIDIVLDDFEFSTKITYGQSFNYEGKEIIPVTLYDWLFKTRKDLLYLYEEDDFIYYIGSRMVNIETDQWEDYFLDDAEPFMKVRNVNLYDEWTSPYADRNIVRNIGETVQIDMINYVDGYEVITSRLFVTSNLGITEKKEYNYEDFSFEEHIELLNSPTFANPNSLMPLEANKEFIYQLYDFEYEHPSSFAILDDGHFMWDPPYEVYEWDQYRIYKNNQLFTTVEIPFFYYQLDPSELIGLWHVTAYNSYDNYESASSNSVAFTNQGDEVIVKPNFSVQSYPNPWKMSSDRALIFDIKTTPGEDLTVELFNIKGQKVATLYNGKADSKESKIQIINKNIEQHKLSSGIYFYKVKTNTQSITQKMLLIK